MSNVGMIIEERAADIGNFLVGRLLPFRQKRSVGPFVFIDHMGPAKLKEYQNLDVDVHPHIGLSTLTYLFEGAIMHRDSMGSVMEITPGAVNWMNAGIGCTHSERTPEYLRQSEKSLHGLQIWVALPKDKEEMQPSFHHIEADQLPSWQEGTAQVKLIAGEVLGRKSPVPVHSRLYFLEIKSSQKQQFTFSDQLYGESAIYILEGSIVDGGITYESKQILVGKQNGLCSFEIQENSTIYIFGGEPFEEDRFIFWNFVSSEAQKIEKAKQMWIKQEFPKVPGETKFVPLPEYLQDKKPI